MSAERNFCPMCGRNELKVNDQGFEIGGPLQITFLEPWKSIGASTATVRRFKTIEEMNEHVRLFQQDIHILLQAYKDGFFQEGGEIPNHEIKKALLRHIGLLAVALGTG